jgi:hypothetical protein
MKRHAFIFEKTTIAGSLCFVNNCTANRDTGKKLNVDPDPKQTGQRILKESE